MKKIVMIGPVYPYKGGIAHYTGFMVKNLKKDFEVHTVSYKMQYPKFMYKKEQRDYENDISKVEDAEYLINTANPFNWLSTAKKIRQINPDHIIIQWWHPYFSPCYFFLNKLLKKYPKIFVCHNVFPHERFPMDKFLTKLTLKTGSAYITHSHMDADDLRSIISDPVCTTTVHPTYNAFKLRNITASEAYKELGIAPGKKLLLFFGFVREYKGLKHIINAMPKITDFDQNIQLLIVGEFGNDKEEYMSLIKNNNIEANTTVVSGYVPDKEIEKYFAASDIVVLPYESATQSGIVQIAYGFDKPVIATRVGGLPDVVIDGKTGFLVEPKDPDALADAVIRYFRENKEDEFSENVKNEAYKYSWDRMNEVVGDIIKRISK